MAYHTDTKDNSIITRHRTREISFLPKWAAANKPAFYLISKETAMEETKEIPAHKLEEFNRTFGEEQVKKMEAELAERSQEAKDAGVESKEKAAPPDDVVGAIQALVTVVKEMGTTVQALEKRLDELEKDDGEKIAQKAAAMPAASLAAFVKSELFTKQNQVEKKGPGPQEVISQQDGSSGLFFNELGWTAPVGMRR
jgi:hypothetical protein